MQRGPCLATESKHSRPERAESERRTPFRVFSRALVQCKSRRFACNGALQRCLNVVQAGSRGTGESKRCGNPPPARRLAFVFFPSGSANRTKKNRKTENKKTHHDVIGRRDRQPQRLLPEEKPAVERVERDRRGLVAASLQGRVRRVRRGGSRSRAGLLSAVGSAVKVCGRSQRRDLRRPPLVLGDRCLCSAELQPPYRRRRLGGGYGVHSRKRKGKKAQAQRFFFFSATSQEEREREREREP